MFRLGIFHKRKLALGKSQGTTDSPTPIDCHPAYNFFTTQKVQQVHHGRSNPEGNMYSLCRGFFSIHFTTSACSNWVCVPIVTDDSPLHSLPRKEWTRPRDPSFLARSNGIRAPEDPPKALERASYVCCGTPTTLFLGFPDSCKSPRPLPQFVSH